MKTLGYSWNARPVRACATSAARCAPTAPCPIPLREACRASLRAASASATPLASASKIATATSCLEVQQHRLPALSSAVLPATFTSKPTRRIITQAVSASSAFSPATDDAGIPAQGAAAKLSTALVVGSGMGGLAAAAALSDHFDRVVILEADEPKDTWKQSAVEVDKARNHGRPGVGQYNMLHVLLARGASELEKLVPGFTATLLERGAVQTDFLTQTKFVMPPGPFVPVPNSQQPLKMLQASRHLIEQTLRHLVTQNPKIVITYGSHVTGLGFNNLADRGTDQNPTAAAAGAINTSSSRDSGSRRVVGVRLADGRSGSADLVVVANGRRSDMAGWLKSEGWAEAPVSKTTANCRYVCWPTKLDPAAEAAFPYNSTYRTVQPPHHDTAAFLQRIEGDIWLASVAKYDNQGPRADVADVLQFMQETPYINETYDMLKDSTPLSDVSSFGRMGNTWHHYEKVLPPEGLLIMGDAYCNFNPIYGQGMTVAAIEAGILKSILTQRQSKFQQAAAAALPSSSSSSGARLSLSGLAADFYPAAAPVVAHSWLMAALRDLTYPFATSENEAVTWSQRLLMGYVDVICKLATFDTEASEAFCRAIHMLDPPAAILKPSLLAKSLAHVVLGWPWGSGLQSNNSNKKVTESPGGKTPVGQLAGRMEGPHPGQSQPQS